VNLVKMGRKNRTLDGGNLYLQVRYAGVASWILRFVSPATGKVRELGLGSWPIVGLAEARGLADDARALVRKGSDPIEAKRKPSTVDAITFGAAAEAFFKSHSVKFRNERVRERWLPFLTKHAAPLWDLPVAAIDNRAVLSVIEPLWRAHHFTAKRLTHRIGQVLDYGKFMGWRDGDNPARWRGNLAFALPKPANQNTKHFAAVEVSAIPALMSALDANPGTSALAAQFAILMAARPGEAIGMTHAEVDRSANERANIIGGEDRRTTRRIAPTRSERRERTERHRSADRIAAPHQSAADLRPGTNETLMEATP
jgi:integrase